MRFTIFMVIRYKELNRVFVFFDRESESGGIFSTRTGLCINAYGPDANRIREAFNGKCRSDMLLSARQEFENALLADGHRLEQLAVLDAKTRILAMLQLLTQ